MKKFILFVILAMIPLVAQADYNHDSTLDGKSIRSLTFDDPNTPGTINVKAASGNTSAIVLTLPATSGTLSVSGGSGNVSSGTINQEAVYTGSTQVGSGAITDNGNIGIGSTSPAALLDIEGNGINYFSTNVGIGSSNPQAALDVEGAGVNYFGTNVGIGSVNPGQALDVQGTLSYIGMQSPDGTHYKCKPANGGTWGCS